MESVPCNLCGSDDAESLFTRGDLSTGRDGTFTIVRCRKCGLQYLNPRPTQESILFYYPPSYPCYTVYDKEEISNPLRIWWRDYIINKYCRAVRRFKQSGRILDVGCATGRFLNTMRNSGDWECHGVELNPEIAGEGAARYGFCIKSGTVFDVEYEPGFFDVVTLWDVIEHVQDPLRTLRHVTGLLKQDGLIALTTPVSDALGGKLFGRYWVGYEIPRHFYFFSTASLETLVGHAGLNIISRRVLQGSDFAFADNVKFLLRGIGSPGWLYESANTILRSSPWRWFTAPAFKLLDLARLTTPHAVFCTRE